MQDPCCCRMETPFSCNLPLTPADTKTTRQLKSGQSAFSQDINGLATSLKGWLKKCLWLKNAQIDSHNNAKPLRFIDQDKKLLVALLTVIPIFTFMQKKKY